MIKRKSIIALLVLICMSLVLTGCTASHSIPKGTYHPGGKSQGLEYAWQIKDNEAEHLYIKYNIIEDDGKIYLHLIDSENPIKKFEIDYDSKSKFLTVKNIENNESFKYKR